MEACDDGRLQQALAEAKQGNSSTLPDRNVPTATKKISVEELRSQAREVLISACVDGSLNEVFASLPTPG